MNRSDPFKFELNRITLVYKGSSAGIERAFRLEYFTKSILHIRFALVIGILLYSVFGLLDYVMMPDNFFWFFIIRYAVFLPTVSVIILLSFTASFRKIFQPCLALSVLVGGIGIVAMIAIAPVQVSSTYYIGLILVFCYGYTFIKIRFIYAFITAMAIVAVYEIATIGFIRQPFIQWVNHNFFLLSANLMGMFISYSMEYYARRDFHLARLLNVEQEKVLKINIELSSLNGKLQLLSDTDELTSLANRRVFQESIVKEWSRAQRDGQPLSLIMVDVDYFKKYNDYYGHQKGDDCLKRVASALKKQTRRPADLPVRYGGEEFIILLPNTDTSGATTVADNIKNEIHRLAIVHKGSQVASHLTVSMGFSTIIPEAGYEAKDLIKNADDALYEAKETGRDRYAFKPFRPKIALNALK